MLDIVVATPRDPEESLQNTFRHHSIRGYCIYDDLFPIGVVMGKVW